MTAPYDIWFGGRAPYYCPQCNSQLEEEFWNFRCTGCDARVPFHEGIPYEEDDDDD